MLRYPIIECRKHICQRIVKTVGSHSNISCDKLDGKLQLQKKFNNESSSVHFQVSIKDLRTFDVSDIHQILNMNSDSIIKNISKNYSENQENIIFHIEKSELLNSVLKSSLNSKEKKLESTSKNKILVEFSSPNIAKPFHVGHLRSTIVGNFVANIMELSNVVKRLNYLGDWGTQIGYIKLGLDSIDAPDVFLLKNPMKELYKAYNTAYNKGDTLNDAKKIFAELEKNSSLWSEQWEKIRSITVEHLIKTYRSFGIIFDEYLYESQYRAANIPHVIDLMRNRQLICLDNDCLAMEMDGTKTPLFKSDGTTLYLVRDIASALDRLRDKDCDTLMYVVDKSQTEHMNKLQFVISKLVAKNLIYVPFGRVTGMSTRKGTSIFLDDILSKTVEAMSEQQLNSPNTRSTDPEVTRILGVTCLMVYILRQRRNRDFQFSWKNALQASGDTGSKLQYTHCRLNSLEKNCGFLLPKEVDASVFTEPIVFELIFELTRFQDVLNGCQQELESSFLISYLFKLCNTVSRCLKDLPIKGQPSDIASQRLLLFHTVKQYLNSSMKILGLQPLDEM